MADQAPVVTGSSAAPAPAAEAPAAPVAAAPEAAKPEAPKPRAWSPKAKPAPAVEPAPVAASVEPAKPKGVSGIGSRKIAALEAKVAAASKDVEEAKALREELAHYAKRELEAAPENARKFVLGKHKDDPRAQLAALRELRDAGLLQAPAVASATTPATTLAPNAPKATDSGDADVALAREWQELAKKAPGRAAQLRLASGQAIDRGLAKLRAAV